MTDSPLKGRRAIDPSQGLDARMDVAVQDGAKSALDQSVRPRSFSADLTIPGRLNTVHSLAGTPSRFIALGFSIADVIRMATSEPAKALDMDGEIGSLAVGRAADVSVIEEHTGDRLFRDADGGTLRSDKALTPVLAAKADEVFTAE